MNPVALLTPTYGSDLELCALLCESVDRHVSGSEIHYLLVPDSDVALFSRFENERRKVLPASAFLPSWLKPLPRIVQRKRRQFWWSLRAKPVSGWHVQQLLKIAAVNTLPFKRYCILDSDIVFFRDYNLARYRYPNALPLLVKDGDVTEAMPRHTRWIETSHALLGLPVPALPAADFIDHIVVWDQDTIQAMISRIEAVTGRSWIEALCRTREFSEYMLYGYFVQNHAGLLARHTRVSQTPCVSYWDLPMLGKDGLERLLRGANADDVAFSVASFSGTPVETIRAAVAEHEARLAGDAAAIDRTRRLAARC